MRKKIAIVHDWLPLIGGAEKVLQEIHTGFPGDIYTLMKNDEALKGSYFAGLPLHTSFIQNLPFAKTKYRNYLPLFPMAIEGFDLSDYELVISSSYAVAKGVLTNSKQLHICYCHSPVRYAWDLYFQYLKESNLQSGFKSLLVKCTLHYLRMWDLSTANRPDYYIANSHFVARRIKKLYNQDSTVIYPPVDTSRFTLEEQKEDFYLTASRMVPYKKIDLIVAAFTAMPDKKLVVIGDGPDFKKIQAKAGPNVELLGYQEFALLREKMQKAKAFVFAAEEDFGITPVEAQACGTPVIAFRGGGATETIVAGQTGLFFDRQTVSSLVEAVNAFEKQVGMFKPAAIRQQAEKFSTVVFQKKFSDFIEQAYATFYCQR
ncbi:MAG: glycosyltransferase family 4 protein [Adhaeribacter sp.]